MSTPAPTPAAASPTEATPRLLVINPNTSSAVTVLLHKHIQQQLAQSPTHSAFAVDAMSARFGPAYIASETAYAIAAHACIDVWAAARQQHVDARSHVPWRGIVIGCFGDPGLLALRELSPLPVTGLAEGAFAMAARHGRFGIVTGGKRWQPMLERLAQALHYERSLAAIHTVHLTGAQLMADRSWALQTLQQACEQLLRTQPVDAIIIGGAALAGMSTEIQARIPVPLIDSVEATTGFICEKMQHAPDVHDMHASPTLESIAPVQWTGLSSELSALLASRA